jgi:hypothetical protein
LTSKRVTTSRCLFAAVFLFAFSCAQAQITSNIPQIVDGGVWLTTIALTNTSASQSVVSLSFFQETGGGNTSSWPLNFVEMPSAQAQNLVLAGGSSLFLHTLGTAANATIGWAQLSQTAASAPVVAYAIFTQRVGTSVQDGTAPAGAAVSRILVPFNNTNGAVTGVAIANTSSASENISVGIRTASATTQPSAITLPAKGHMSFALPTQFTATAGQSGLAEFYSSSGSFSILALTFQSTAFTTAPVYSVSGPPIIASSNAGGGGGGAGNIVAGGFTVAQVQVTLASSSGLSESIGGDFASYTSAEWQAPFAAPTFGPCGVLDVTPASPPLGPDTYLDAGTVTVSGPNLPSGTNIPVSHTKMGPSYDLRAATGTTLALGGTYTITGSGGTQIGPFSASATLPNSFTVTNFDAITSINRANGVTVNWTGSGFDTVGIGITGQSLTTSETVTVSCIVPGSLGTFSIPQGALAMLFPTQVSTLTVTATSAPNPGTTAPFRSTLQTLVPSLVGGGQVNYGAIGGQISVLKSLPIQ